MASVSSATGAKLERFSPPGHLDDLSEQGKAEWSANISNYFERVMRGRPANNDGPRLQFFHPLKTNPTSDRAEKVIDWQAFPRLVEIDNPGDARFAVADQSRDDQDEYCEWSVVRRADGKITRVTFTCEGPEYWKHLAATDPQKVVDLYKQFVDSRVEQSDLFTPDGKYQPKNKWNSSTTSGAMHLIQPNNTLFAEIEIAAASTLVREKEGRVLTGAQELIKCGRYGQPERHSDPHIGEVVNELARAKAFISLKDPVGLYFQKFEPEGWETPDGTPAVNFWKVARGTAETPVRAVYEVPSDKPYCVGDIKIRGKLIEYGGQIADFIRVGLTGIAQQFGKSDAPHTHGCWKEAPVHLKAVADEEYPSRFAGEQT